MKKMVELLLILLIIYFGIQVLFQFIDKGYVIEYSVKTNNKSFDIIEKYVINSDVSPNYKIEIDFDSDIFEYEIFENYNMSKKIVTNIYYYNDDYKCIIPEINYKLYGDIYCKINEIYYYYKDIRGLSYSLDNFANNLDGYYSNKFEINFREIKKLNNIKIYDNLRSNEFVGLENYKGLYRINNNLIVNDTVLFKNDIYVKSISYFVDKYYVVADYSKQTKFNKFIILNITNDKTKTIEYDYDISLDSYILGSYNKKLYLFDNDTKKEYEIDLEKETIIEIGNQSVGIKMLINGKFDIIDAYTVYNNKMTFTNYETFNDLNNIYYDKVIKVGDENGYYYMFEKAKNGYKVYRSSIKNSNNRTYLFNTTNDNLLFGKDCIYYVNNTSLYRYSDSELSKIIFTNPELEFNNKLKIGLYSK